MKSVSEVVSGFVSEMFVTYQRCSFISFVFPGLKKYQIGTEDSDTEQCCCKSAEPQ